VNTAPTNNSTPARDEVLRAALEVFLDRGFAAARIEDIAQRASVGKGSVYLHFRNKKELFQAVIDEGIITQIESAEAFASNFSGGASELLTTLLKTNLVDFWGTPSSGIYKLIVAESAQFPELAASYHSRVTCRARELVERILQLGIEQGEYRDMDVDCTAHLILNALDNEQLQAHSLPAFDESRMDPHRFVDALMQLLLGGLRVSAAAKDNATKEN
jgi:AcrR family transcriptional regulator